MPYFSAVVIRVEDASRKRHLKAVAKCFNVATIHWLTFLGRAMLIT